MPRPLRKAAGGVVYHVINRANGRLRIFKKPADFLAFERVISQAIEQVNMRICGYCIMGTHWHFAYKLFRCIITIKIGGYLLAKNRCSTPHYQKKDTN